MNATMDQVKTRHRRAFAISRMNRGILTITLFLLLACLPQAGTAAESLEQVERRLTEATAFLASDDLEGRGLGTVGLEKAAAFVAEQFAEIGLKTDVIEGGPFQKFQVTTDVQPGEDARNRLVFHGPDGVKGGKPQEIQFKRNKDFRIMAAGGSTKFDLPVVFAGYGISSKEAGYDDYEGIDVKGKAVLVLRHQPQRGNPHSPFGEKTSRHAYFSKKITNAYAHGAAAIIFCTAENEIQSQQAKRRAQWQTAVDALAKANEAFLEIEKPTTEQFDAHHKTISKLVNRVAQLDREIQKQRDPVLEFFGAGPGGSREVPIFHCTRAIVDQMLAAGLNTNLAKLEKVIDHGPSPRSALLKGCRISGESQVLRKATEVKNIVAVLEGEGPRAHETIVIGAHYDHLGMGGISSAAPGVKKIHNGADDNGSGTAVLLEIARRLTQLEDKLPRRIVFIAFTGEERGLLGSGHYIKHPLVPLKDTIAMLNLDMVGRLRDERLIVNGIDTAAEFEQLVDRLNSGHQFKLKKSPSGFGPSDHASFYEEKIPVMHFFTGAHADYHRPSDDVEKLNVSGMRRIGSLVADIAHALAEAEQRPLYKETKREVRTGGRWPYFGSRPDYGRSEPGVRMAGVAPDSPAERGGVQKGDIILRFGDSKIGTVADFASALSKHKAGDKVKVVVRRGEAEKTLEVTLDPPR